MLTFLTLQLRNHYVGEVPPQCYYARAMNLPRLHRLQIVRIAQFAFVSFVLLAVLACGDDGQKLDNATIKVGCGRCMFHMPEAQGCPFAAEIDGKHYLIQGRVPEDHQNHAKDGICNMVRDAQVTGTLRDGKLITTELKLKPAQDVPEAPQFTEEDIHE